jgi:hypothetical protein
VAQRGRRQKRKRRQRGRREDASPASEPRPPPGAEAMSRGYARSHEKDEAARAALSPLESGERPTAVTVGAILALIFGLANLGSYIAGLEVAGDRPSAAGVIVYSGLMFLVAYGMWIAKYWAVLGMEALLGLIVVIFALLAVRAENFGELAIALAVIGAAGTLFWFLIKAMARIQMPERPGASRTE